MNVAVKLGNSVQQFKDIFCEELFKALPPKQALYFENSLKSYMPPLVYTFPALPAQKFAELWQQLADLVENGFLQPLFLPFFALPTFFVQKKCSNLRMIWKYNTLNKVTIQSSNWVPLFSSRLGRVSGAAVFSKVELLRGFWRNTNL